MVSLGGGSEWTSQVSCHALETRSVGDRKSLLSGREVDTEREELENSILGGKNMYFT